MFEKRFAAVPAQVFTVDGGADGVVSVADTSLFKVKQQVIILATGLPNLDTLEVKKVLSPTQIVVGPQAGNINSFVDVSAYTVALSAQIFANEQRRPVITGDEFERATYEEEPTVAKRVILVDEFGNRITDTNPLPTSATVTVGDIVVDTVGQGAPAAPAQGWPVKVTDGTDTVGITDVVGDKALKVDVVKSVSDPLPTLTNPMYVNDAGFIAKSVSYFYTVKGDVDRIETTIGSKKKIEQFNYSVQGDLTSSTVIIVDV